MSFEKVMSKLDKTFDKSMELANRANNQFKKKDAAIIQSLLENSTRKGWIEKRGPKENQSWKRRWFVLKGHVLYYFENDQELKFVGKFVLEGSSTALPIKDDKKPYSIKLMIENKPRILALDTQAQRQEWIKDLISAIQKRRDSKPPITGFLLKQGPKGGAWKKRFCVLDGKDLYYYKQPRDELPAGFVDLSVCTGVRLSNEGKEICLEIQLPSRKFQFMAESFKHLEAWSQEIKKVVASQNSLKKTNSTGSIEAPKKQDMIVPISTDTEEVLPEAADEEIRDIPLHRLVDHMAKLTNPYTPAREDISGYLVEYNWAERHSVATLIELQNCGAFTVAASPENVGKNRYFNVLPPEHTRVILPAIPGIPGSDYINANFIDGLLPGKERQYVAAQGPLPSTIVDFWRMVWATNASVIVMLTREVETEVQKCSRYWPIQGEVLDLGEFEISLFELGETTATHNYIIHELVIADRFGNRRNLKHIQYVEWPDHGIPESTTLFLNIVNMANEGNPQGSPIIVHCSAGLGRTGTFIMVHSVLEKIKHDMKVLGKKEESITVNIPKFLVSFRSQRPMLIQTDAQYEFCYMAILDGVQKLIGSSSNSRGLIGRGASHYHKFPSHRLET